MWIHHVASLANASWQEMTEATGTSTLGILAWGLVPGALAWSWSRVSIWRTLRRTLAVQEALRQTFDGGLKKAFLSLGTTLIVMVVAWACCIPVVIYKDHQHLVKLVRTLQSRPSGVRQLREQLEGERGRAEDASHKANYWREAFISVSNGRTIPDRFLSTDDTSRLHRQLKEVADHPHDPKLITGFLEPMFYDDLESTNLTSQIFRVFEDSGWRVKWESSHPKFLRSRLQKGFANGIVIFASDYNRGEWLAGLFRDVGVDAQVDLTSADEFQGILICVGYKPGVKRMVP